MSFNNASQPGFYSQPSVRTPGQPTFAPQTSSTPHISGPGYPVGTPQPTPLAHDNSFEAPGSVPRQPSSLESFQDIETEQVFGTFDMDNDKKLNIFEVRAALTAMGFSWDVGVSNLVTQKSGPDEYLNFAQFRDVVTALSRTTPVVQRAFKLFADDHGHITHQGLLNIATTVNPNISEQDVADMINEFDLDCKSYLDYHDFDRIMRFAI